MADKTSNIYINGKQAGDTLSDLKKRAGELNKEINQLAPGTEAYNKKMEELGKVQGTLNQHAQAIKNAGTAMSTATKTAAERLQELNERVNSGTLSSRQLSKAVKEYETIALQAGRTSPVGQQAIQDGAQLVDELADLRNEIVRASHDGKNMQAAMQLGSTVIAGYGAAQAGMALLGTENEELKETFIKLQAATTLLNSVEMIRANLEKESFLMQKARNLQAVAATAITYMYTTAVGSSTGALKLFRLALIATGIGAIVVGIGLLIANFEKVTNVVRQAGNWFNSLGETTKTVLSIIFPFIGAIRLVIAALEKLGIIESEQEKQIQITAKARQKALQEETAARRKMVDEAIAENKRQMWSIGDMYDFEIEKAKAAGKNTYELEKEKRAAMLLTHQESIRLNREALMLNATSFSAMLGNVKAIVDSEKAIIAINRTEELEEIRRRKEASDAAKKAAETAKSEAKKMSDELAKLKENELKYRADLETNARIERLKDEEKEQAQAQLKIEQKYAKDLESARKLALQKGEIGRQAAEQLQTLEVLMAEELEAERLKIKEKWEKQNAEKLKKLRQDSMKRELAINSAMLNTEMAEAKMVYNSIADHEVEAKEAALREIERLTMLQLENERDTKLNALKNQLENEEINLLEFQVLKEQLEAEHQLRIEDMNRETQERIAQSYVENMTNALETTKTLMSEFGKLRDALHAREMQDIATERDARISALDEQLNSGLISEREHADKVQAIKDQAAEKERAEKTRQAQAQKGAALIEAAINTALAVISGFAQGGPPMAALAAVVGALQVATIAAQPIPQFKDGGFNVTGAQDGKSYQAKYIGKHPGGMLPNHPVVLASEAGPEYFVPNPLLHNPVVLDAVRTIENIRLRQFAQGGATQPLPTPMANANGNENEQLFAALLQSIQQNSAMQQELMRMLPNLGVYFSDERIEKLMERNGEIAGIRA